MECIYSCEFVKTSYSLTDRWEHRFPQRCRRGSEGRSSSSDVEEDAVGEGRSVQFPVSRPSQQNHSGWWVSISFCWQNINRAKLLLNLATAVCSPHTKPVLSLVDIRFAGSDTVCSCRGSLLSVNNGIFALASFRPAQSSSLEPTKWQHIFSASLDATLFTGRCLEVFSKAPLCSIAFADYSAQMILPPIIRRCRFCWSILNDVTCPGRKHNSHFSTCEKAFVTKEKAEILVHLTFCLCEIQPKQTNSRWENTQRVTEAGHHSSNFYLLCNSLAAPWRALCVPLPLFCLSSPCSSSSLLFHFWCHPPAPEGFTRISCTLR